MATIEHIKIGNTTYDLPTSGGGSGKPVLWATVEIPSATYSANSNTQKQVNFTPPEGYTIAGGFVGTTTQYLVGTLKRVSGGVLYVNMFNRSTSQQTNYANINLTLVPTENHYVP